LSIVILKTGGNKYHVTLLQNRVSKEKVVCGEKQFCWVGHDCW